MGFAVAVGIFVLGFIAGAMAAARHLRVKYDPSDLLRRIEEAEAALQLVAPEIDAALSEHDAVRAAVSPRAQRDSRRERRNPSRAL